MRLATTKDPLTSCRCAERLLSIFPALTLRSLQLKMWRSGVRFSCLKRLRGNLTQNPHVAVTHLRASSMVIQSAPHDCQVPDKCLKKKQEVELLWNPQKSSEGAVVSGQHGQVSPYNQQPCPCPTLRSLPPSLLHHHSYLSCVSFFKELIHFTLNQNFIVILPLYTLLYLLVSLLTVSWRGHTAHFIQVHHLPFLS